jgi:BirA family biotin operon repressor/biotin-[acetyl-CoA-carboxylase] ligase
MSLTGPARFLSRQERFDVVGSTNDVVRGWLAQGTPEVCLALADEQSAGRGRQGRTWTAPRGRGLLLSLGFRPTWLEPDRTWQLGAIVSLAMADAAEEAAGLAEHAIRLKWPNDMVVEDSVDPAEALRALEAGLPAPEVDPDGPGYRKLAGVLGETGGLGTTSPTAIIGVGLNADWSAGEFPRELAAGMTSLREASHGRPVDLIALFDGFLSRLEVRVEGLRGGRFDVADWRARQLVVGRDVRLGRPDGGEEVVRAVGVDSRSGALVVADPTAPDGERHVLGGEVRHLRLARV